MVEENLKSLLEQASESGARRALALLGLDDSHAAKDMGELRELLSAWRDAKRSARKAAVGWLVRMALALLLIGLAVKLGLPLTFRDDSDNAARMTHLIRNVQDAIVYLPRQLPSWHFASVTSQRSMDVRDAARPWTGLIEYPVRMLAD